MLKKILFILLFLLALGSIYFLINQMQQQASLKKTTSSTVITNQDKSMVKSDWLTYTNESIDFSFSYPKTFGKVQTPEIIDVCGNSETNDHRIMQSTYLGAAKNLGVLVACQQLGSNFIDQYNNEPKYQRKEILFHNKRIYIHSFVTATGYDFKVIQLALDDKNFLELDYSYRNLTGYIVLTDEEWVDVATSVSFP